MSGPAQVWCGNWEQVSHEGWAGDAVTVEVDHYDRYFHEQTVQDLEGEIEALREQVERLENQHAKISESAERYARERNKAMAEFTAQTHHIIDLQRENAALRARCDEQARIIGELTERNRAQAQALEAVQNEA